MTNTMSAQQFLQIFDEACEEISHDKPFSGAVQNKTPQEIINETAAAVRDIVFSRLQTPAAANTERIIFLDIDGVLNNDSTDKFAERSPGGYVGIDPRFLYNLKKLVEKTMASIVFISNWADGFTHDDCTEADPDDEDAQYLLTVIKNNDLPIAGRTRRRMEKSESIWDYLHYHPEIKDYVVLDGTPFKEMHGFGDRYVYTFDTANMRAKGLDDALLASAQYALQKSLNDMYDSIKPANN